jgi:Gpi18-like mannosyltransferase
MIGDSAATATDDVSTSAPGPPPAPPLDPDPAQVPASDPAQVPASAPHPAPFRAVTERCRRGWDRVPPAWRHVVGLFLFAKATLTVTGLVALHAFDAFLRSVPADGLRTSTQAAKLAISTHQSASMWFAWDSLLYERMERARPGFDWDLQFGFPPLYPLLGRALAALLGGHTFLSLFIVSNVSFLLALYYGYRLVEKVSGDEASARRFTRYLVLMPAAFLFQAALTESLFLLLVLASFYYAEQHKWIRVGVLGFCAALSRSVGFLLVVPLLLVLVQQGGYRLRPRALLSYARTGYPLLLVPGGWLAFMAFCRWQTGDWLRYSHLQVQSYSIVTQSPLRTVWTGITTAEPHDAFRMWFAVAYLVVTAAAVRYVKPAYVVYALLLICVPLGIGVQGYRSLIRYLVVVFPVCMVFAAWGRRATIDMYLSIGLALTQGVLWVTWLAYWTGFIV